MKYYNEKIAKFINWMKDSAPNPGDDPIFRIPTLQLFHQYQLESEENVEDLTDKERDYLEVYSENLIFALSSKGIIRGDLGKFFLEAQRGWSAKAKPDDNEIVDYVSWDFSNLATENTTNHDNEDLTNEAIPKENGLK